MSQNESKDPFFRSLDEKIEKRTRFLRIKLKKIKEEITNLEEKDFDKINDNIHDLEIRIKTLEIAQGGHEQNWKLFFNFFLQAVWVIMAAYILYKLGLQAPL